MNFVLQIRGVLEAFAKDSRINPSHISLYMSLFHMANLNHFPEQLQINRSEIMQLAKIGSLKTYHKCIKELDQYKYICYQPSHNKFKGSKIILFTFGTTYKQDVNKKATSKKQAVVHNSKHDINYYKQYKHIKTKKIKRENVIEFFKNEKSLKKASTKKCEEMATKFFNFYESIGWKTAGNPITNWQAAAENWIHKAKLPPKNSKSYLHASDNAEKNYNKPL